MDIVIFRYLQGDLSHEELISFKQQLKIDENLQVEVNYWKGSYLNHYVQDEPDFNPSRLKKKSRFNRYKIFVFAGVIVLCLLAGTSTILLQNNRGEQINKSEINQVDHTNNSFKTNAHQNTYHPKTERKEKLREDDDEYDTNDDPITSKKKINPKRDIKSVIVTPEIIHDELAPHDSLTMPNITKKVVLPIVTTTPKEVSVNIDSTHEVTEVKANEAARKNKKSKRKKDKKVKMIWDAAKVIPVD